MMLVLSNIDKFYVVISNGNVPGFIDYIGSNKKGADYYFNDMVEDWKGFVAHHEDIEFEEIDFNDEKEEREYTESPKTKIVAYFGIRFLKDSRSGFLKKNDKWEVYIAEKDVIYDEKEEK